jgi:hypothetical protein
VLLALMVLSHTSSDTVLSRPALDPQAYLPFIHISLPPPGPPRAVNFGADFVTSDDVLADEGRFAHAISSGARLDRWPFYWWRIEVAPGVFDWGRIDQAVIGDINHGFSLNAILMIPPGFYLLGPCPLEVRRLIRVDRRPSPADLAKLPPDSDCTTPRDLEQPVFSDGSDWPGPGKAINPNNPWARFVYETVRRYKPGGILAQQQGWPAGIGIRHWEMWNEPDFTWFWNGDVVHYARLLKVGYLATYQADPSAEVLFGGLSNVGGPSGRPAWFNDTLNLIANDPDPALRDFSRWYFTIHARHNYSYAWATWSLVNQDNVVMAAYGLVKPVWVNESGVPACDDYPGPPCDVDPAYHANMEEQAAFTIQSAVYAMYARATAVFHFQLYDDCGDTAWGMYRNPASAPCHNQHPNPDTPRPLYDAYRVLTANFGEAEPLWWERPGGSNGSQEWIAFYRPSTRHRLIALWARFYYPVTAQVPATGPSALRIDQTGAAVTIYPVNGVYTLDLPAATNHLTPTGDGSAPIGGRPYILIETDTQPPSVIVAPLPPNSPPQITLTWTGYDSGSGIGRFQVWASVDGGPLALWLETSAISAIYSGSAGHSYGFAVRPMDRAGNWAPIPTAPQVTTSVP